MRSAKDFAKIMHSNGKPFKFLSFVGRRRHFNSGTKWLICILNTGINALLIQNVSALKYLHVHQLSYFTAHEPCVAVLPSTYLMFYYAAATPPPPLTTTTN